MQATSTKKSPGTVRDAILRVLQQSNGALTVKEIEARVEDLAGTTPPSSVRSYLRLNTPETFVKEKRGVYRINHSDQYMTPGRPYSDVEWAAAYRFGNATLVHGDCFDWIACQADRSIHAVVTDPPYGLHEYSVEQQQKLRNGRGGVWRIPPSFDGNRRSPLPRFTTLSEGQLSLLKDFFTQWAQVLFPKLVPGAHIVIASNPLLSYIVSSSLIEGGLERRGEIIRLTMTMRGGDRPKSAHREFPGVSVMPRSMWEPWIVYRKPIEGRVQDNLRKWKTGGLRRPSAIRPFGDVIESSPTRKAERALAPHPSLKPQAFLRKIVRAVLPLGQGIVLDPFAGAGSTLAAAEALGYTSTGVENDPVYFHMASAAIPKLVKYIPNGEDYAL